MRLIRSGECRRMPWKNGGGETIEIAISPAAASVDDFDWRLSTARVDQDGPFSLFPGIDRTLAVLEGEGLVLSCAGAQAVTLTRESAPYSFPGDLPTQARLVAGPITDLNVMTRRGRCTGIVRRIEIADPVRFPLEGREMLIHCAAGSATVSDSRAPVTLNSGDTVHLANAGAGSAIELAGRATIFLICFLAA